MSIVPDIKFPLKRDQVVDVKEIKPGYWLFELRAGPKAHISRWVATNSDGQPVTRLATATLYVDAEPTEGEYVEIIGFAALS